MYLLSSDQPQDQIISSTIFYLYCFLSIIPFLLCQIYHISFSPFSFLFYCFQLELCNKTAAKSHYCPASSVGLSLPIFSFSVTSLLWYFHSDQTFSQWLNIFTVIKYCHSDQIFSQWSNWRQRGEQVRHGEKKMLGKLCSANLHRLVAHKFRYFHLLLQLLFVIISHWKKTEQMNYWII